MSEQKKCAGCGRLFTPFNSVLLQTHYCFTCAAIQLKAHTDRMADLRREAEQNARDHQFGKQQRFHRVKEKLQEPKKVTITIGLDMINRMLRLCHPDKHNNSDSANTVTRFLLEHRK